RGARHLDDGPPVLEPPARLHGRSERPGDDRGAIGAAEGVERTLTTVGEWQLPRGPARGLGPGGDRAGGRGRGDRAAELVGRGDEVHYQATYGIVCGPSGRTQTRAPFPRAASASATVSLTSAVCSRCASRSSASERNGVCTTTRACDWMRAWICTCHWSGAVSSRAAIASRSSRGEEAEASSLR